jgi:hypothetical protein
MENYSKGKSNIYDVNSTSNRFNKPLANQVIFYLINRENLIAIPVRLDII